MSGNRGRGGGARPGDGEGSAEIPDEEPLSSDVFKTIRRFAGGAAAPLADVFSVVEEVFAPHQREARLFREERKRTGEGLPAPTDLPNLLPLDPATDLAPDRDPTSPDNAGHDDS